MKASVKNLSVLFVMILLSSLSLSAATVVGETHSDLGRYWLKKAANHMTVDGTEIDTYSVHYDNLNTSVYIGIINKTQDCTEFIVKTDDFEVLYTCKNGKFGIKHLPSKYASRSIEENKNGLNMANFSSQKRISNTPQTKQEMLSLIAAMLPNVMQS